MKYFKTGPYGVYYNPIPYKVMNAEEFNQQFTHKYGADYLSSEADMMKVMLPRVERIEKLNTRKAPKLLDIGTCYGTFLQCLSADWEACGFEANKEIANHAAIILKRDVWHGYAESFRVPCLLDIVTMWNVIEHLEDPEAALLNINRYMSKGGLLCISTPNADGGYFKYRREAYEITDDPSHIWVFSPRTLGAMLEEYGFKVVKVVITGHHPERWGGIKLWSKLFRLGDTFEIYARKV
jgi:2-polyprenyl-3-methyl-5-hydroxy-6-metoxy-1,4-benzoquinol methylase